MKTYLVTVPNLAAGPYDVVEMANDQIAGFSKSSGDEQFSEPLQTMFGLPSTENVFDPRIVYDDLASNHYALVADDAANTIYFAMSPSNPGTGTWCYSSIDLHTLLGGYPDFPQLGVDPSENLEITVNMYQYDNGGTLTGFEYSALLVVSESDLLSCSGAPTVNYWYGASLKNPDGSFAFAIDPAVTRSSSSTEYLVDSYESGGCYLNEWLLNPSALTLSDSLAIPTQCYNLPINPQEGSAYQGTAYNLDAELNGNRLDGASFYDGRLDVAMMGAYSWNNNGVENDVIWWFRLNPAQQTVDQQGGFGNSGENDIYPAVIEDAYGNDYFVYDEADPSNYPNTRVQSVNTSGTATGWITLHGSSDQSEPYMQLESGSTNLSRWGDYSGAAIEPTDNAEIWTVGEFELNSTTWGSWIGEGSS